MEPDLTYEELRVQLVAACRARKWKPPSRRRLQKLRDSGQVPKAIPLYEKGRRGRAWRYPESTVVAYIRTEERRRASGRRVRSWKLEDQREKDTALRSWLSQPAGSVPRDLIVEVLEDAFPFQRIVPRVSPYIESPVFPDEDDPRTEDAEDAIASTLKSLKLNSELSNVMDTVLRLLIFRNKDMAANPLMIDEIIKSIVRRAGLQSNIAPEMIRNIVRDIPLTRLLMHPQELLEEVSDAEFLTTVQFVNRIVEALRRFADILKAVLPSIDRDHWLRPMFRAVIDASTFLQSDNAAAIICFAALGNVWAIRRYPEVLKTANGLTGTMIANCDRSRASLQA